MILISLASRQIWPQVLAALHLRPASVVLLHSDDVQESRAPARRLKRFFDKNGPTPDGAVSMETISDSDFTAIENRLDELAAARSWNLGDTVLNLTGGNKLMATAAFRWAARRGVRTFYLERRHRVTRFDFRDGETTTTLEVLDPHAADDLCPVALLRCQLDASEVERKGEKLTLNAAGQSLDDAAFFKRVQGGDDASKFLEASDAADSDRKRGDALELATAAVLLKLGVRQVRRSLRLKVKSAAGVGTAKPHAEFDLLFSWDGKLWLVDCKDRKNAESLTDGLERELRNSRLTPQASELLQRIKSELSISQTKVMKEDLIAIREAGGLLGQVVCVRKDALPEEVAQYARHNHIEIVQKNNLAETFRSLLHPSSAPSGAQLQSLADAFKR